MHSVQAVHRAHVRMTCRAVRKHGALGAVDRVAGATRKIGAGVMIEHGCSWCSMGLRMAVVATRGSLVRTEDVTREAGRALRPAILLALVAKSCFVGVALV